MNLLYVISDELRSRGYATSMQGDAPTTLQIHKENYQSFGAVLVLQATIHYSIERREPDGSVMLTSGSTDASDPEGFEKFLALFPKLNQCS